MRFKGWSKNWLNQKQWLKQLHGKGRSYWLIVVVLILLGLLSEKWLSEQEFGIGLRYKLFQSLQDMAVRAPYPERTIIVKIGDEEYWKGELASRAPIKRDFLAKLLKALDAANPAVIAFDFDLRSPTPDGSIIEHPDYQRETELFLNTVKETSVHRKIVLPQTIGFDEEENYVVLSDIYKGFDFGSSGENVLRGYIALPYDVRQVPLNLDVKGQEPVDSFAEAIVRAYSRTAARHIPGNNSVPPYGSYIRAEDFETVSATQVLSGDRNIINSLDHKIVIVGGVWHSEAYDSGSIVDSYFTPVGSIPGVFIHANYVEALMDLRTYRSWKESILVTLEVLLALAITMVFALEIARLPIKLGIILLLLMVLIALSFFSWQVLGLFFDFIIPLTLLGGHFLIEQILHWRTKAKKIAAKEGAEA